MKNYYLDKHTPALATKETDEHIIVNGIGNYFPSVRNKEMTKQNFMEFKDRNNLLSEDELGQLDIFSLD